MTTTAPVVTTLAVPFTPAPPEKFSAIVEACSKHRPWFHDFLWNSGPEVVRQTVIAHLADAFSNGKLWEVWRGSDLVGILLINELVPFIDARCHFLFFDSKLSDKEQLCLNMMAWAYDRLPVETLRVQIPTYARALLKFVRNRLGFKYEAEHRSFSWPQDGKPLSADEARLGSRLHKATVYEGVSHDVLLLSQTREEFVAHRSSNGRSQGTTA